MIFRRHQSGRAAPFPERLWLCSPALPLGVLGGLPEGARSLGTTSSFEAAGVLRILRAPRLGADAVRLGDSLDRNLIRDGAPLSSAGRNPESPNDFAKR